MSKLTNLTRRSIVKAVAGSAAIGWSSLPAKAKEMASYKIGEGLFAEVGIKYEGIPDVPTTHSDPFLEYEVNKKGLFLNRHASNEATDHIPDGNSLIKSDRYTKLPSDLFGDTTSVLPVKLGRNMTPTKGLQIVGEHKLPAITINKASGRNLELSTKETVEEVPPGKSLQLTFDTVSVQYLSPTDEFEMIMDPRLESKRRSRKYESKSVKVNPVIIANNHGYLPIYREG